MSNLDSIFKSRDITLPTKVCLVKAMVFQVVMYGCEIWTVKKAECRRINAFELWCWRRLLRVPWTARRSNQSILKENSPGCSLEWLMLKLKLQYFGHLMRRADSLGKNLMLGKTEGGGEGNNRGWDSGMASPTQWTWVWASSGSWWWTGKPGVMQSIGSQSRTRLSNWTELNSFILFRNKISEFQLIPLLKEIGTISSVQSLSGVRLFATPWIAAHQASLSVTNSRSSLKLSVHQVGDAIQPSHPLSSPSPPAPNPSQHQGLFQWVNSSHEVAKVLEFQLQHHSFQRTPRTNLL